MHISQRYTLNKTQAELDFVDIDPEEDLPLFLDPFFLGKRTDNWSIEAALTVKSFFQKVIELTRAGEHEEAQQLFEHLREPNSTCLGMSDGNPRGRGVGNGDTYRLYQSLLKSRAIQTGLIQDLEDSVLFVDYFGKDKLSDMTTNIITRCLIIYTQNQCDLNGISMADNISTGYFWNRRTEEWEAAYDRMLVIDDKKILLVPKGIVSFSKLYTPERYYNHFILNFLQQEHLRLRSALVERRVDGTRFVTKKSIAKATPNSKEFLRDFTREHPEVLQLFKDKTLVQSLVNHDITDISISRVINTLIGRLRAIPTGNNNASDFHTVMIGILQLIFYPTLINPVKELEIHNGRKRIDICFDNDAQHGIFRRLSEIHNIFCPYVFVECKNYSSDITNPELDQLSGRFSVNRGRFGFIICRNFDNFDLFIERCRDTYRDGRGLIVPICDDDIILLLQNHNENDHTFLERFIADRVRLVILN